MLTIPQKFPIKRMAIYGSTAIVVGFTGTLLMLRQFAPKDSPSGVAIVEMINKKPSTSNGATIVTKQADGQSIASVTALPDQGPLVVRNGSLSSQPYTRVSTTEPTYVAPSTPDSIATAPAPTATTGGSGSVAPQQPTATQPSSPTLSLDGTTTVSNLRNTVTDTNVIDINKVSLP